jgi:hypothetical protein
MGMVTIGGPELFFLRRSLPPLFLSRLDDDEDFGFAFAAVSAAMRFRLFSSAASSSSRSLTSNFPFSWARRMRASADCTRASSLSRKAIWAALTLPLLSLSVEESLLDDESDSYA